MNVGNERPSSWIRSPQDPRQLCVPITWGNRAVGANQSLPHNHPQTRRLTAQRFEAFAGQKDTPENQANFISNVRPPWSPMRTQRRSERVFISSKRWSAIRDGNKYGSRRGTMCINKHRYLDCARILLIDQLIEGGHPVSNHTTFNTYSPTLKYHLNSYSPILVAQ
jgi:hypothetical protein